MKLIPVLLTAVLLGAVIAPNAGHAEEPASLEGVFVVQRGTDLWLVSLTNPALDRQLTFDSRGVGYAGWSRQGGQIYIYYTSREAESDNFALTGVYRAALSGGAPTRLFEFTGMFDSAAPGCCSVTKDGAFFAFVDVSGLRVADLFAGGSFMIRQNSPPCSIEPPRGCSAVRLPRWSTSGAYLTLDDAKAILKAQTVEKDKNASPANNALGSRDCSYTATGNNFSTMSLTVISTAGIAPQMKSTGYNAKKQYDDLKRFTKTPTEVKGIGDDAFIDGKFIHVLKKDVTFDILIFTQGDSSPALKDAATRVAAKLP
jgi:hypothetical protein